MKKLGKRNPNLIAISGKIGSGKDEVAKIINNLTSSRYEVRRFADTIKDITCMLIGCTREQLEDRKFKESLLGTEWAYNMDILTPRKIMQLLGTECGRQIIHQNIWVNSLFSNWKYQGKPNDFDSINDFMTAFPNWIISDMRYLNEMEAVEERLGITIRVERPTLFDKEDVHASETGLDNVKHDYTIHNDGNLEDLERSVGYLLKKEGLING